LRVVGEALTGDPGHAPRPERCEEGEGSDGGGLPHHFPSSLAGAEIVTWMGGRGWPFSSTAGPASVTWLPRTTILNRAGAGNSAESGVPAVLKALSAACATVSKAASA